MVQGRIEDIIVLQKAAGPKSLASGTLSFDGERLFARTVGGKLRSLLLVNGANVSVGGEQIVKSVKPLSWVAVSFDPTGTKVYASSSEPSLTVLGANDKPAVSVMHTDELND